MSKSAFRSGRALTAVLGPIVSLLCCAPSAGAVDRLLPKFNGKVTAISAPDSHGVRYVGGEFTGYGFATGGAAVLSASSAAVDRSFPNVRGNVSAIADDGQGGHYIGGDFNAVDGSARPWLAHLNSDGSLDPNWNPPETITPGGSEVLALAVANGKVYVGTTQGAAAFNSVDGSKVTAWNPLYSGGTVNAIAVHGSTVYLGGQLNSGSYTRALKAVNDTDGAEVRMNAEIQTSVGSQNPAVVYALAATANGLYIGGDFSHAYGACCTPRNNLAAIDYSGNVMSWNPNADGPVRSLAVSGSTIYVGGSFSHVGGTARKWVAAVSDAGAVQPWAPALNPTYAEGAANALSVSGSTVYIGGDFDSVNGTPRGGLAAVGTDGVVSPWTTRMWGWDYWYWRPADPSVKAIAPFGASVMVGGNIGGAGMTPRSHLAAIDSQGQLKPWNPPGLPDLSLVNSIALSGTTVYIGGKFTRIGSSARNNAAAISTAGALLPWNPNVTGGSVNAMAVAGSNIYLAGTFNKIGRTARTRAAAVSAAGVLQAWDPRPNNGVNGLVAIGSNIYMGGDFSKVGSTPRSRLAAVSNTGVVQRWNASVPTDGMVGPMVENHHYLKTSVATLAASGTRIYVGGHFRSPHHGVFAIGTNGNTVGWHPDFYDYTLDPANEAEVIDNGDTDDTNVDLIIPGGSVTYLRGNFTVNPSGGVTRSSPLAFNSAGAVTSWTPNQGTDWISVCLRS